ncbi:hypothetical protein P5673_006978 [Acropora cervicornis]|uniref:Uncharacterized protein n=1 Tax=Acropora cervicornis TaxID=6130 RepID=A0AAD9QWQ2_ACRCE|nr:hypothetical protein P5673_006978 [Acropora cervicornis]
MTNSPSEESDSSSSEGSQVSDAEDPNFMEQDDQIDETELANLNEAFSDDEGSSSMSPDLTPRALRKRGRTHDEDTSPELLKNATPVQVSPDHSDTDSDSSSKNKRP